MTPEKAKALLLKELSEIRSFFEEKIRGLKLGRATTALVEDLIVDHYNSRLPIKQLASIRTPDAETIVIEPWDRGALVPIGSAIEESDLSLQPINDGRMIRISLPPMSAERRQEAVKILRLRAEESRIAGRNEREEIWKAIVAAEKSGQLTEDDRFQAEKLLNEAIGQFNRLIDERLKTKEAEILEL